MIGDRWGKLTPREQDVLKLFARGLSMRGIAQALSMSPRTVENHMRTIRAKLGTEQRAELVEMAVRRGLLDRATIVSTL